jgi:hypothetical protein
MGSKLLTGPSDPWNGADLHTLCQSELDNNTHPESFGRKTSNFGLNFGHNELLHYVEFIDASSIINP